MTLMKPVIVRVLGIIVLLCGLLAVFALVNPATSARVSGGRVLLFSPVCLILGLGLIFLRKWAAIVFLALAVGAIGLLVKYSFEPRIWKWGILINLFFIGIAIWACLGSWRQLK
jgi:hypothetical protein